MADQPDNQHNNPESHNPDEATNPLSVTRKHQDKPSGPLDQDPEEHLSPAEDVAAEAEEPFVDGFGWKTVIGALFIGIIMMPGAIYLSLVAGQGIGPAAEWVTIILFMEVARRSYQVLKKQEIYLLYYIGGALTSQIAGIGLAGGVFSALIWNNYTLHIPLAEAFGITQKVPTWVVPPVGSDALIHRTFMHPDWLPAIGLLFFTYVFGRCMALGLGYILFRITSDIEQLPFPLAPIAAEGATALAESSSQHEGWRWRIFSIGAMIGVGWGAIYVLIPTVTSLIFAQPIVIVSNPWIDLTANTQKILPAAHTAIGTDLGTLLVGFVLPFPVVVGTFISSVLAYLVANPLLYHAHVLTHWKQGIDLTQTQLVNYFDFWLSFGTIGSAIAVALIGIISVARALLGKKTELTSGGANRRKRPPIGRGDVPIWSAAALWAVGTAAFVGMTHYLVPGFNLWIVIFFGFIWTPLMSYINARMSGLAGTHVSIPYLKEASFMMTKYSNVDIWFAPIPLADYSSLAQQFRTVELTRTKFTSIIKVELLMIPIMFICSFLFWSFIWRLSPIPSATYQYAAKMWPVAGQTQVLWYTSNRLGADNVLMKAINLNYIAAGAGTAFGLYGIVWLLGLPILLFYGLVNGLIAQPFAAIPMFIGAMLGRYYFEKRYGKETWRAYAPVLVAGYYCGMGLIGMGAVAIALLSKSISSLPF